MDDAGRIIFNAPETIRAYTWLKDFIARRQAQGEKEKIKEIILGVNWNPEGENTADYAVRELKQITNNHKIKISHLGKGLSMGTELEYADSDTLKNALRNRS